MNANIRAKEVRVVAPDGSQVGVKKTEEAIWLAEQLGLDLVEVAPGANPPVCKILDYGKFKYEQSVRDREARKKQTRTVIKEVRMKPRIGDHDYQILLRKALQFLGQGDKVKVTVRFRGRENERPELGYNLVNRLAEDVGEYALVEQRPQKDGRMMTAVLAPTQAARELRKKNAKLAAQASNADAAEAEAEKNAKLAAQASDADAAEAEAEAEKNAKLVAEASDTDAEAASEEE